MDTGPLPLRGDRLKGRRALVVGAGSSGSFLGTGAAIAVLFGAQGAEVGVLDLSPDRAASTCRLVEEQGGRALPLVADITETSSVDSAIADFEREYSGLDVLVNNTGISSGEWETVMAVNVTGAHIVSESAHRLLAASGSGSVINIASIAALRGFGGTAYSASKGALLSLTTDCAYRWGEDGIRVNALLPGHLHTPMGDHGGEDGRAMRRRANLLGAEGTAWDIAWAALFLAGRESRFITAAQLNVDGGTMMATGLGMAEQMRGD